MAQAPFKVGKTWMKRCFPCQTSTRLVLGYNPFVLSSRRFSSRRRYATDSQVDYDSPKRGPYPAIKPKHISALGRLLSSPNSIMTTVEGHDLQGKTVSQEDLASFNTDWMGKYHGHSQLVIKPKTVEEVSAVVEYCFNNDIAMVPQGGNTGLVGGGVPVFDEVIINLANMNKIRSFDKVSGIVTCDAGIVLEILDNYLAESGYTVPLDLGAKGSCQIGGNVATNAGGLRVIRYGSLRGTVLGLEVVLPDGRILDSLNTLRKDNTGFDLKQLFIGSEGSIGIITGVSILAAPRLAAKNVAVFALKSFDAIQNTFVKTRQHVGEILSAFEFFDLAGHKIQQSHASNPRSIFDAGKDAPFYALIETTGSNKDHDDEKLTSLLQDLLDSETIIDGVLAQDTTQFASLWQLREGITEAAGKTGKVFKYDVSLPASSMYELVDATRYRLRELGLYSGEGGHSLVKAVIGFGHFGDGNLHLNVIAESYAPKVQSALEPFVYEFVSKYRGSISAEHGLGLQKAPHIGYSQGSLNIELMRKFKKLLDPKNISNPYKFILPERRLG
ncbi:D-lactate dehydrogenase [Ramaria rubella]|nr:D-lactate dehydrogenase [Ramaria rubella]